MNDDEILVLSLTRKQLQLLVLCVGFTRANYILSNQYKELANIVKERLKEVLLK